MYKEFLKEELFWIRKPKNVIIDDKKIEIYTEPNTDLWQRTYYGFRNDNAPILQTKTKDKYFSFTVKTVFESKCRFDQCGVAIYIDSENWFKASIEYENENYQRLGSVVTNNGYSDWATQDISASIKEMHYRLSRRESDFLIEYSEDGENFKQMRIFHLFKADDEISFGIYACSPEESYFKAVFSDMYITECKWQEHK
ncbi:DUF1349 domain-containing protein [Brachyspira innocens]|uniref:DUF1349 domain-containing protein n=1 Tax=Brachyspira innocens TaxID=13264 RepID=UPI00035ECAD1|nr:DUF1349 domain-containing protein [Brachyspira innocens]